MGDPSASPLCGFGRDDARVVFVIRSAHPINGDKTIMTNPHCRHPGASECLNPGSINSAEMDPGFSLRLLRDDARANSVIASAAKRVEWGDKTIMTVPTTVISTEAAIAAKRRDPVQRCFWISPLRYASVEMTPEWFSS